MYNKSDSCSKLNLIFPEFEFVVVILQYFKILNTHSVYWQSSCSSFTSNFYCKCGLFQINCWSLFYTCTAHCISWFFSCHPTMLSSRFIHRPFRRRFVQRASEGAGPQPASRQEAPLVGRREAALLLLRAIWQQGAVSRQVRRSQ